MTREDILSDVRVRYTLSAESNKEILLAFLNAVRKFDNKESEITNIEIKNPFQFPEKEGDKYSILDIVAEDDQGRKFNIEIENKPGMNFIQRIIWYLCKLYVGALEAGTNYSELKPAIFIGIVDDDRFLDEALRTLPVTCFTLQENRLHIRLTNMLEVVLINLSNIENLEQILLEKNGNDLYNFTYLFKKGSNQTDAKLQEIIKEDPIIAQAYQVAKDFMNDERTQAWVDARLKAELLHNTRLHEAKTLGIEEGIEQATLANAKAMKADGVPSESISKWTGLTAKQIAEL